MLDGLPGLHLDPRAVADVLEADDPLEAGIAAAVRAARAALAVEGVEGVNLSCSAASGDPLAGARIKAEIARRLTDDEESPD